MEPSRTLAQEHANKQNGECTSDATWQLILERETVKKQGKHEVEQALDEEMKKGARKDTNYQKP